MVGNARRVLSKKKTKWGGYEYHTEKESPFKYRYQTNAGPFSYLAKETVYNENLSSLDIAQGQIHFEFLLRMWKVYSLSLAARA